MKLIVVALAMLMVLTEVNAKKLPLKNKRQGFLNLGATPTAYPTIPSFINQLTSNLFQKGNITGVSPIYQFLSSLTSQIYPAIANATYDAFMSLNPLINGISSNIYTGLCSPPSPKANSSSIFPPIESTFSLLPLLTSALSSLSPTSNPISNILGPITSLLSGGTNSSPTPSPGSTGSLNSALPVILGGLSGAIPNLLNPLSFLNGVTGPNGINGTLGLSPEAFLQLLASLGYNAQSLQQALQALIMSAQDFVNGFNGSQTPLQYLQSIFNRAALPTTTPVGSNSTGLLGSLNPTLAGLGATLNQLLGSLGG